MYVVRNFLDWILATKNRPTYTFEKRKAVEESGAYNDKERDLALYIYPKVLIVGIRG